MPDPLDTVSAQELFDRGVQLVADEDYVRAEQYLVAAMERGHPEDAVMPPLLASCVQSSRLSAALRYAEPYLDRHPEAWSLRLLVATIHMGLGDAPRARDHLVRITVDRPDEPSAHYMLAVLSRDALGDADGALLHFQRYAELAPEGEHAEEARAAVAHPESLRTARAGEAAAGASPRPVRLPSHEGSSEEAVP
jgi:predicted Zn-dependent protease